MTMNDRRRTKLGSSSVPPILPEADWDDETTPGLVLDDPLNEFDRVTAIPELPTELYVQRAMATVEDSRVPGASASRAVTQVPLPHSLAPDEYVSLDSDPLPPPPDAESTAPYAALSLQQALTARPAAVTVPVQRPNDAPPASQYFAELDSVSRLKVAPSAGSLVLDSHAPLPLLELSLEDEEPNAGLAPEAAAIGDMKDRYAMGDFTGALVVAESIIESNPENPEAPRYAQSCRDVLTQMYSARLGSLEQIVSVAVPSDQVRWLTLDHRAGFLLSLIDGGSTVEQLLDISGMTRLDALRILYQLLDQRVIALGA